MTTTTSSADRHNPVANDHIEVSVSDVGRTSAGQNHPPVGLTWLVGVLAVPALVLNGCGSPSSMPVSVGAAAAIAMASTNVWSDIAGRSAGPENGGDDVGPVPPQC
jgi:hypothetical protein